MKKLNIVLIFIIFGQFSMAQSFFFKSFKNPSYENSFSALELSGGNFVLAGEMRTSGYYGINEGYLLKMSPSGEIIKEVLLNINNSSRCSLILPYQYEGADLLCIGSSDSVAGNDTYSRIEFLGLDSDLNIIYQKPFAYQKNYIVTPWQFFLRGDSILYLMCNNSKINNEPGLDMYYSVIKYHLPFERISNYEQSNFSIGLDLYFNELKKQLNAYYGISNSIAILDEDLNYISNWENNNYFPSYVDLTGIDDSNYLLVGGTSNHINTNLLIGCIRYNSNDVSTDSLFYTPSTDTNFYSGARQSTAISGNSIFFCGIYNVHAWPFPYNYNPSWISVTKTDMNLNIISSHFYGGDAQYCPYSIIPTADGGCFINGYSYDYLNNLPIGEYELDIFALKVNSDGLLTGLPEHPEVKAHDAILYPNPGSEYAIIQSGPQITGAQFTLFNMQGLPVITEKIQNTQIRINTTDLPKGFFTWQIEYQNKLIESGKWVKE
jgi:hypothetical protein